MAEMKTKPNRKSVAKFIKGVEHEGRREDSHKILAMMEEITGEKPVMWGDKLVGFGAYHYKYGSGHEGDWFLAGFSPRKSDLSIHIMPGFKEREKLLAELGKHKAGSGCVYIKRLEDVKMSVLRKLIKQSIAGLHKWLKEQSR